MSEVIMSRDMLQVKIIHHILLCERSLHQVYMFLTSPETRMYVLPGAVNRMIVSSFIWTKHQNVTEVQTNGQTDRNPLTIARSNRVRCTL